MSDYEIIGGRRVRMYWYTCGDLADIFNSALEVQVRARNMKIAKRIAKEKLECIRLSDVYVRAQGIPRGPK